MDAASGNLAESADGSATHDDGFTSSLRSLWQTMAGRFSSFAEFYPTYLAAHSKPGNRRLHFFGCVAVLCLLSAFAYTGNWLLVAACPVVGYGLAWIGHFTIEKNRPASFGHPLYSLLGDWVMFKDILVGKVPF